MKDYGQYCGLAKALELIGDRWTLLIVRELLHLGPRRFTDIEHALPGIAPNLLTSRLRDLETAGLVRRTSLPKPARGSAYELTEQGQTLREPVMALTSWGMSYLPEVTDGLVVRPELPAMAFSAMFDPAEAVGVRDRYRFDLDGHRLDLVVDDGRLEIVDCPEGDDGQPTLTLTLTLDTFTRMAAGHIDAVQAATSGDLTIDGDSVSLANFARIFQLPAGTAG